MATLETFQTLAQLLLEHFDDIEDPRVDRTKLHPLKDLLTIALCSTLAGGPTWEDMPLWASAQGLDWLRESLGLELPNGIAHHDTFARTICRIPTQELEPCLSQILSRFRQDKESIAIDGKVLKGSGRSRKNSSDESTTQKPLTLLNVWANDSRIMLAQHSVPENTNEIGEMQSVLEKIEISGCVITADAAHCQKKTVETIRKKKADYLLTLKENQPKLHEAVSSVFNYASEHPHLAIEQCEETSRNHGRQEWRCCKVISVKDWLLPNDALLKDWTDICSIVCVERKRQWREKGTKRVSHSQTYYISSCAPDAGSLLKIVRGRWGIENRGHYVLDVIFGEDSNRSVRDYGPGNLALLRRVCMNLVRVAPGAKGSLKGRIKQAGWSHDILKQFLSTPVPDSPLVSTKTENSEGSSASEI
jgi:predicted transposase YbfD/YdcC